MTEAIKKRRTFKLGHIASREWLEALIDEFDDIDGVTSAVPLDGDRVRIEYDLRRVRFDDVVTRVDALGGHLSSSVLRRLHVGWIRFSEQNEYDSAVATPSPCCSDPDFSAGGRKGK